MDRNSIWIEEQNKPTLVVRDLAEWVDPDVVYASLLRRGVFKWLTARRQIIKLKNVWRDRVTASIAEQRETSDRDRRSWLRGYRAGVEECRREVREICHGPRWQAPDIDRAAIRWLEQYEAEADA